MDVSATKVETGTETCSASLSVWIRDVWHATMDSLGRTELENILCLFILFT